MMVAVAVASYGEKYLPMLLSFLESWGSRFSNIYLALGDVRADVIKDLEATFPSIQILTCNAPISGKENVRISQKMIFWAALAEHPDVKAHPFTIFADADTVLVRDVDDLCVGDVVLTLRSPGSKFIINTGVVGISRTALQTGFMEDWSEKNQTILTDPTLLAKAVSPKEMYGGGDQMAIIQMLGLSRLSQDLTYKGLQIRTVACDEFNACENKVDPAKARIYHLKASLHKFLLDRRPLIGSRRPEDSISQLRAAIQANETATRRMRAIGISATRIDRLYRFRLPRGIRGDLSLSPVVTALHRTNAAARRIAGSVLSSWGLR